MKLATCAALLAVIAVAFAAPQGYGEHKKIEPKMASKGYGNKIITTTLPANDNQEFDCTGKENRGYSLGCMQDYFLCWDEVMTKASCPEDMIFNQELQQCDHNINVFECTGVRTQPTVPVVEEEATLPPVNFDCSKLEDGDYPFSHDCQENYISCVGGLARERTCPDNLSFDPENRVCERLENIVACGGAPTTVAPEVEIEFDCPQPSGSFGLVHELCSAVYYICENNKASIAICEAEMIWDDKNKICALPKDIPDCFFDCSGKADAAYSSLEGCSQNYWYCWEEKATKLACPEGMLFDGERGLCDIRDNIFECTGVHTTLPADVPQPTMKPVDFDCSGLEDGQHAFKNGEKCQPKFVSCVGGLAWEMMCPDNLMFDPESLMCERIENIVACGGVATTTLGEYEPTEMTTKTTKAAYKSPKSYNKKVPTTTVAADDYYGEVETTTLAEPTTTKAAYAPKKLTTVRDIPTTKGYGKKLKPTTVAEPTTTLATGYNYNDEVIELDVTTTEALLEDSYAETTTLAEPTTRRSYQKTTTIRDLPTTKSYGYKKMTTIRDIPTTKAYKKLTTVRDLPTTKSYGGYSKKLTTLAEPTTTKSYGYEKKTTIRDIPTTKSYKKLTTVADLPTTKSYGGYQKETTIRDLPTTRAYHQRKLTTLADVITTKSSYGKKLTTPMADIPAARSYY